MGQVTELIGMSKHSSGCRNPAPPKSLGEVAKGRAVQHNAERPVLLGILN